MSIEKGLYAAPKGIDEAAEDESAIEIEIIDPEEVNIGIDGLEISLKKGEPTAEDFDANLADFMSESAMAEMASTLTADVGTDKDSRKDWEETYKDGLKLLGLKYEERTEPWNGACGVFHPMITEAVVRFQSETIMETFPAKGPVMTKIVGKQTPVKQEAARRVAEDMNYQLTEVMVEFRPEHERMLWSLPATGSAFKKVYYDPSLGRQTSVFVPAEDVILPYGVTDIFTCYRVTHVMRKTENEIVKLMNAGFYREVDLGEPDNNVDEIRKAKDEETGFSSMNDDRYELFEVQVDLDLEGYEDKDKDGNETGIALPYIVTVLTSTNEILAIRRNWSPDDRLRLKRQHFVHYQYIPGFGSYGFGLFHLIGGYAKSATSLMRQLVDAGTLSNLPGGLKTRGLRIKGDDTPINPGEFRDVDVGSGSIRDNILPLPYKEPSMVLAGLMDKIVEEGRRFAASADTKIADMSANAPVGTTLAILERTLKVMSAVQARVHFSFKQELKMLAAIMRDYSDDAYDYEVEDAQPHARKADFSHVEIIPVSDPNAATLAQRVVQYQSVIQLAQMAPQIYNLPLLHRQMLDVLGIKDANKLVPIEDDQKPVDPVQENMNLINGKPVKAFIEQDHEAHIAVHMAGMQDPKMAALIGQNPMAQQIQAAAMAHINEHMAFEYRKQIELQLGASLPTEEENENMDPAIAAKVAQMAAVAAQRLLQQNQAQAAQQQAQQQAQDPLVQMQQQELAIKQQDSATRAAKVQADAQFKAQQLALEEKRLQVDAADKADKTDLAEKRLQVDALARADDIEINETKTIAGILRDNARGNQ
jgi:hypothetical protein